MNHYEEGMKILDEKFGNFKDNIIALATISLDVNEDGLPKPCVREVDAYYEDGVFYVITYAKTNKVKQIEVNPEVSIAVSGADFYSSGVCKNLGWVLDPKNAAIREKIRKAFSAWYDDANDESDPNFVYLAIYLTKGKLRVNHGEKYYLYDFSNKEVKIIK